MSYSEMSSKTFFWVLQGLCALHRKPFSLELAQQQLPAPYTQHALCAALAEYELQADTRALALENLPTESFPLIAWLHPNQEFGAEHATGDGRDSALSPALLLQADGVNVLFVEQSDAAPRAMLVEHFLPRYSGEVTSVIPQPQAVVEAEQVQAKPFGFAWFVPELLKHRKLWQEIVLASLVLQLIALATPLFTQAIIDKVVVHRTESTLIVIAIGMLVFMSFSAVLSWLRQYLVLHTGNRVDAALGAAVFARLFKLPPLYFQHRATGVIAARLQGIETIREFIASAAMTLVLDLPFLLIFVAIMFYYNVNLTLLVLAMLGLIVGLSLMVAPLFQTRLQHQFQLGARNQAFVTEYISGLETVKSLQLEPVLNRRYSGFLSSYLQAGFATRQLANTYNTFANLLEQMMGVLILTLGAYSVMQQPQFTIGMLVAFQMFSGRLSQPMLRLVGLWQQFQQARLSLARLGDLMNAPIEPYAMQPARGTKKVGRIEIEQLAFKYAEHLPLVYQSLNLTVEQGQVIALMGASGSGKSTLAKLLQGFYQPSAGRILLNGVDIRYLSANELRSYFGVVPQETTLFSGTIYDNLHMTNPEASFEQIIAACEMAEIHQTIEALPQGYQTEIGERGAGLSGGQKQRIAIARALLKRPSILIFDEATSALDATTAEQFAQTINALRGKVTIIFIAHGLPKGLSVDALYRIGLHGAQQLTSSNASFRATVPAAPVHPHMPPAQAVSSIAP